VLLDALVTTADAVASTRSRLAKVDALAALLTQLEPDEIVAAVGFLVGKPRQGRVGVGWRGVAAARGAPAIVPSLTIADLDELVGRLAAMSGAGSASDRSQALRAFTERATEREQDFVGRVLLGEMRTGALDAVVTDAVARAADRSGDAVRRAAMLSGDLGETARLALTGTAAEL
jgi:DNA ligase-1